MSYASQCELSCGNLGHSDFLRPLVVTKSQEDGLPQLLFGGQFLIGDLRHHMRSGPCSSLPRLTNTFVTCLVSGSVLVMM